MNHLQGVKFTCTKCNHVAASRKHLKIHEKSHAAVLLNCTVCSHVSTSQPGLRQHMLVHSQDKAYKCSYCPYTSRTTRHLNQHMSSRHEYIMNSNSANKRKFNNEPTSSGINNNISSQNITNNVSVTTENSNNSSSSNNNNNNAMLLQDSGNNIKTPTVSRVRNSTLRRVNKSTYPRNFKCEFCESAFARADSLRSHVRQHIKHQRQQEKMHIDEVVVNSSRVTNNETSLAEKNDSIDQVNLLIADGIISDESPHKNNIKTTSENSANNRESNTISTFPVKDESSNNPSLHITPNDSESFQVNIIISFFYDLKLLKYNLAFYIILYRFQFYVFYFLTIFLFIH